MCGMETNEADFHREPKREEIERYLRAVTVRLREPGFCGAFRSRYTALDLEMSGLNPWKDEIIEVGAVRIRAESCGGYYHTFVHPRRALSETAERITGITGCMLENAPAAERVFPELLSFIGEDTVLLHNAEFSCRFLARGCGGCFLRPLRNPVIDTGALGRVLFPWLPSRRLTAIARVFGLPEAAGEGTISGALATAGCFEAMTAAARADGMRET